MRNRPKRSAKWCGSSASDGSAGASAARSRSRRSAAHRVAVLGEHRAGLDADADRPQHVAERRRHPGRDREQRGRDEAGPGDPQPQQVRAARPDAVGAREHDADRREAQREDGDVARRRRLDRDRRDAGRHAAGEEEQPLGGVVGAVAVGEDREPDPRPPQDEEQPEHDPHVRMSGCATMRCASWPTASTKTRSRYSSTHETRLPDSFMARDVVGHGLAHGRDRPARPSATT